MDKATETVKHVPGSPCSQPAALVLDWPAALVGAAVLAGLAGAMWSAGREHIDPGFRGGGRRS